MEIRMNVAEIKLAVDAGKSVHWANEGYRVHRDGLGQYLITFAPNGSTIGLTDRGGRRLNGAEADFFISEPGQDTAAEQGRDAHVATWDIRKSRTSWKTMRSTVSCPRSAWRLIAITLPISNRTSVRASARPAAAPP